MNEPKDSAAGSQIITESAAVIRQDIGEPVDVVDVAELASAADAADAAELAEAAGTADSSRASAEDSRARLVAQVDSSEDAIVSKTLEGVIG